MKLETPTLPKVRVRSVISVGPHVHPSTGLTYSYLTQQQGLISKVAAPLQIRSVT